MQINDLTPAAMQSAAQAIEDGPVVMVNLLWFRDAPDYPEGFDDPKPDARSAYFEGYAGAFRAIAWEQSVTSQLVYVGHRLHGLLAGPDEDWDAIVIVRYERFADLRRIVESEAYSRTASPHRRAAIANWRFFATRAPLGIPAPETSG